MEWNFMIYGEETWGLGEAEELGLGPGIAERRWFEDRLEVEFDGGNLERWDEVEGFEERRDRNEWSWDLRRRIYNLDIVISYLKIVDWIMSDILILPKQFLYHIPITYNILLLYCHKNPIQLLRFKFQSNNKRKPKILYLPRSRRKKKDLISKRQGIKIDVLILSSDH